ncbi:uncharacterized protein LOC144442415 [Glandiceps talaboti]
MSQNGGRAMTKGQRSGKNSRNLRYLNLSFGVDSSAIKSHGHRPHGGYKGLPNHHPPSILSFNKPPEYLEGVKNDCVVQQEQDKLERGASPQWVHGAASTRNHTGEFPLFTHQYLSSSKLEQLDASGGLTKAGSSDNGSEVEYFRPNRLHQYLTATEMPYDSKRGVDIKLGRPTRTSLLRARHRSQSAPSLNSSQMDIRHLHTIGQITDSASKPKKQVLRRNLLPSTGQESLHQFLTGARYNRVRWIDQHYATPRSPVFRDNTDDDPGYLPPYGSEVSSSNSSTQGDVTPSKEKEKETLPPPVNKPVTPLAFNKITPFVDTEDANKTKETLPPPGKPIPAWDGGGADKGGGGDNGGKELLSVDTNSVLTPKKVTLIAPEEKIANSVSQHELKRHVGPEATCVICCNCYAVEGTMEHGGRGDGDDYQYSNSQRTTYENTLHNKFMNNMSIKGTKVGLTSPGRPKPAPRRVTFNDKHTPQQNNVEDDKEPNRDAPEHPQNDEETPADAKEQADANNTDNVERTEKESENIDSELQPTETVENDPVVSEDDDAQNDDNGAENDGAPVNDEDANKDDVAEETEDVGEGGKDRVEENGEGVVNDDDGVVKETDAENQEEVKDDNHIMDNDGKEEGDEAGNADETKVDMAESGDQLDTYRSDLEETPRSEADIAGGSISVSVTLKDKDFENGDGEQAEELPKEDSEEKKMNEEQEAEEQ